LFVIEGGGLVKTEGDFEIDSENFAIGSGSFEVLSRNSIKRAKMHSFKSIERLPLEALDDFV
jgi:hypothetical protein